MAHGKSSQVIKESVIIIINGKENSNVIIVIILLIRLVVSGRVSVNFTSRFLTVLPKCKIFMLKLKKKSQYSQT